MRCDVQFERSGSVGAKDEVRVERMAVQECATARLRLALGPHRTPDSGDILTPLHSHLQVRELRVPCSNLVELEFEAAVPCRVYSGLFVCATAARGMCTTVRALD